MSLEKKILEAYRGMLFRRCDEAKDIFYFSKKELCGLSSEPYEFKNQRADTLRGDFYYRGERTLGRIVIFEHGLGDGYRSYMREIDILTQHGYTVLAYDRTGCGRSDGERARGLSGSLADLDACICSLKANELYKGASLSIVGHSWGGYSALNIGAYHPDVTHIVAISGFASVHRMLEQLFPSFLKKYIPMLYGLECAANKGYAEADAITSLHKTMAKALIIHSKDDKMVKKKHHFDRMRAKLTDRPNTEFFQLEGKGHNPNYTKEACRALRAFEKKLRKFRKCKNAKDEQAQANFKASFDWNKITEQDAKVWNIILDFLAK